MDTPPDAPRVIIITQARTGSTRLPGKVLEDLGGRTLLEQHLARLAPVRGAHGIVVATTTEPGDDAILALCAKIGVACFRGSEDDVLDRYLGAAREHGADVVVRVTSDCPFLEPAVIDRLIEDFLAGSFDYYANFLERERSYPLGLETEVFSLEALERACREATLAEDREHVTPYLWSVPGRFRTGHSHCSRDCSGHRWTVDTPEDLELARRMIAGAGADAGMDAWLELFEQQPELAEINADVMHKYYGPGPESGRIAP